jgi:hypothetical protein
MKNPHLAFLQINIIGGQRKSLRNATAQMEWKLD